MTPDPQTTARPPLPREVWTLGWVSFFADISGEMLYPLLPLLVIAASGSATGLGLIEGASALLIALLAAAAGSFSDRRRSRLVWVRLGYGVPIAGKALIAAANAFPLLFAGRLLDRLGKGLRSAPRDALLADLVPRHARGRAFGMHRAFDTAGAIVGTLIAAALLWLLTGTPAPADAPAAPHTNASAVRTVAAIAAALGVIAFLLTLFLDEPRARADATTSPAPPAPPHQPQPHTTPGLVPALTVLSLFALCRFSDTLLLLRAAELGLAPWTVVLLYATSNCLYAALSYPAGALSDHWGRWPMLAGGFAVYVGACTLMAVAPHGSLWFPAAALALLGVHLALTDGVAKALVADSAPPDRRGGALGLYHAISGMCALAASLGVGLIWDRWGAPTAFLCAAAMGLVAVASMPAMLRPRRPNPAAESLGRINT